MSRQGPHHGRFNGYKDGDRGHGTEYCLGKTCPGYLREERRVERGEERNRGNENEGRKENSRRKGKWGNAMKRVRKTKKGKNREMEGME